jgi:hypothetical protein
MARAKVAGRVQTVVKGRLSVAQTDGMKFDIDELIQSDVFFRRSAMNGDDSKQTMRPNDLLKKTA